MLTCTYRCCLHAGVSERSVGCFSSLPKYKVEMHGIPTLDPRLGGGCAAPQSAFDYARTQGGLCTLIE